jgi:hypothetical protein
MQEANISCKRDTKYPVMVATDYSVSTGQA